MLTNLLSNAIKFSTPNSIVAISISRHSGLIRIAVTDQGPGIPKEYEHRVFQKFTQAHSSDDLYRKDGTGLGLNIAKTIVEGMGGKIGFETEIDIGTTFYFDLHEYIEEKAK